MPDMLQPPTVHRSNAPEIAGSPWLLDEHTDPTEAPAPAQVDQDADQEVSP